MNRSQRPLPRALAELFGRWAAAGGPDGEPELEAVFSAGHSNRSFLVRLGARRMVVRLGNPDAQRYGIDRHVELRVLERAAHIGIGAPLLFCEPARGTLVTSYLESRPLRIEGLGADREIARLAATLRRLHGQDLGAPALDLIARVRAYARDVQQHDPRNAPRVRRWLERSRRVLEQYRFARRRDALCHNDLVAQNILETPRGLRIIDWEYAARGDPYFDLATLVEDGAFTAVDRERLLLEYGEIGDGAHERLFAARVLYRLLSALWYVVRGRDARQDPDPSLTRHAQALERLLQAGPGD